MGSSCRGGARLSLGCSIKSSNGDAWLANGDEDGAMGRGITVESGEDVLDGAEEGSRSASKSITSLVAQWRSVSV
jgi:hypothetical protein